MRTESESATDAPGSADATPDKITIRSLDRLPLAAHVASYLYTCEFSRDNCLHSKKSESSPSRPVLCYLPVTTLGHRRREPECRIFIPQLASVEALE